MELTPGQVKLLAYWGNIQAAVSQRVTTAELWDVVRNAATRQGVELTGVSATDMGGLRSIVASGRNAMEQFGAAGPNDVITSNMIGTDISARSLQDQNLAPKWIVRFQHDTIIDGQLSTLWRASVFEGQLPPTTSGLRSAVESDAAALADDYGTTHVGVGQIQIVAV